MKHPINIHWARKNLRGFKDLEAAKLANDWQKKRLERKYAGCPKVVPKNERRAA